MPASSQVFGLSHVDVSVSDLGQAARLYQDALGFQRKCQGEMWFDVDAGSVLLRVIQAQGATRSTSLRIQVGAVEAAYQSLLEAGASSVYPPTRTPQQELFASVRDADGNGICVWRPLTEDEFDHVPELPIQTEWSPEAQDLLKSLLQSVPALFRALARRRVVKVAEEMYASRRIDPPEVVRAFILSSAKITRGRLHAPLRKHGYRPEDFQLGFDSE